MGRLGIDAKRLTREKGLEIVPVAIEENARVDNLKKIASTPDRVISCGVNEDPSKLGRKLLKGN